MRTMTISLPPQQASRVEEAVESGAYASSSDVIREALLLWEQREETRSLAMSRLKQAYDEGMASGPARDVSTEVLLAEFRAKARARG